MSNPTTLFQEVQALNQNYSQNAESIEEAKREAARLEREAACAEALAAITDGVEERIKTLASSGRKVRGQYLPRTECCIYQWVRDDVVGAQDAKDGDDDRNRPNKFGKFYLNDLLRKGLIYRLQDWFDENHQCPVPEGQGAAEQASAAEEQAGPEEDQDEQAGAADEQTGEAEDQDGQSETSTTNARRGPRPVPATRAFRVYWNPMRHQEGRFGIFVNWDRSDWERVEKRLRNPPKAKESKAKSDQAQRPRRQPRRQYDYDREDNNRFDNRDNNRFDNRNGRFDNRNGRFDNRDRNGGGGREDNRDRNNGGRFDNRDNRNNNGGRGAGRGADRNNAPMGRSLEDSPAQHSAGPRRLPPRRPNNSNNSNNNYARADTNADGVAHSFHPSL